MNLIEQLGGYSQAKNWLDKNEIHVKHGYLEKYREELLQYRRENNIYEAGDTVVSNSKSDNRLFYIRAWDGKLWLNGLTLLDEDRLKRFTHATDEEIEAGHRL